MRFEYDIDWLVVWLSDNFQELSSDFDLSWFTYFTGDDVDEFSKTIYFNVNLVA